MKMKPNYKIILITIAIVVAVVLLFTFAIQGVQNKAISLEEQIGTAKADVSVQEKRRAELIPNLVDCVKAYDEHEYSTLMAVIEARGSSSDAVADEIKIMISAIAEAYPELKSSDNYKELMNELATTENLIANYRNNYNTWVKKYKQYVRKFPNAPILASLGYEIIDFEYFDYGETYQTAPSNLFGD